jgi:lactoylglutathione lyase
MITYSYTILYVANVEETIDFYIKAFGFSQKLITPEKDYAELETGGTTLAFADYSIAEYNGIAITKSDKSTTPPAFEITFVTDDIDSTFKQAIEAGAIVVTEPTQKPWGQIVGYVRDINGFLVELCTKVEL